MPAPVLRGTGWQKSAVTDETGRVYVTPVVDTKSCAHCGERITVRKEGRTPKFCGPTCRQRHYRATRLF